MEQARSQASSCEILYWRVWHRERFFFSQYFGLPCQYHYNTDPYWSYCTYDSYWKDKRTKHGKLPKKKRGIFFLKLGWRQIKNYLNLSWGKFSQKHNYKYTAKWWCLLAMEKLHVSAYSGYLQVLITFLLKEFYIIYLNCVVMLRSHHHFMCFC